MRTAFLSLSIILFSTSSFASSAILRQWLHTNCGGCEEFKTPFAGELMEPSTSSIDRVEDQLRSEPMARSTPTIRFRSGNYIVEANVLSMSAHSVEMVLPRIIVSERPLRYGRYTYPKDKNSELDAMAQDLCKLSFGNQFRMVETHGSCRFRNKCRILSLSCESDPEKILPKLIRQLDRVLTGVECN